jgi:hypothetical protein
MQGSPGSDSNKTPTRLSSIKHFRNGSFAIALGD